MNKLDVMGELKRCFENQSHEVQTKYIRLASADLFEFPILFEELCDISRRYVGKLHEIKMRFDWGSTPTPEWMNHFQDLYFQTPIIKSTFWMERAIFARQAFSSEHNDKILELCCGDGFNTKHFYSPYVSSIIAVDFDKDAIKHARKYNAQKNISYQERDIRIDFPLGVYDAIIWDAAIEHFTALEMNEIFNNIKKSLTDFGCLCGYTLIEKQSGEKSLEQHEYEFKSKEELSELLLRYFKNVRVFETFAPERHNLYFYAGNHDIPFDLNWSRQV
jgi:ubiquinone/menaquinone biosynthesis C-methylase UbiE